MSDMQVVVQLHTLALEILYQQPFSCTGSPIGRPNSASPPRVLQKLRDGLAIV
jgi:hypothetical protein